MKDQTHMDKGYAERRQSERILLRLNALLLRPGTRTIGCRVLDINHNGAAIGFTESPSEIDSESNLFRFEPGDMIQIRCSPQSVSGRKHFQFPAQIIRREGNIISVAFTDSDSSVDELLKLFTDNKSELVQSDSPVEPDSDAFFSKSQLPEKNVSLPPAFALKSSSEEVIEAERPSMRGKSHSFNWFILIFGFILLSGLGGYLYYIKYQLSDLREALVAVSEKQTEYNSHLDITDKSRALVGQLTARVALMSEAISELENQLARQSEVPAIKVSGQDGKREIASVTETNPVQTSPIITSRTASSEQAITDSESTAVIEGLEQGISESTLQSRLYRVNADPLYVREGPGSNFPVISRLTRGERIAVVDTKGVWGMVMLSDRSVGWISLAYAVALE